MSTVAETSVFESHRQNVHWKSYDRGSVYQCKVIMRAEDGLFSVYAANLPGVASQGATEKEALKNIGEALAGAIAVYREQGEPIPWLKDASRAEGDEREKWVIVNA